MTDLTGFLGAAYPWVKAAHVTFVIYWIAGLLLSLDDCAHIGE